jgi:carbon-monoxide dehydrogenase medium subunit
MKPQAFEYAVAENVEHAVALLTEYGDDAKILAGGQSLLPMMNFRLARPTALVDIGRIPGLAGIVERGDVVRVGTRTTHNEVERSSLDGPLGSLLRQAAAYVGHYPIRVRGTFGGSLAHSDPASEWCQLATLLDAQMNVVGPNGPRTIEASEFFFTVFSTTMEFDEVLTSVDLPRLASDTRVNVVEFARRAGDFAIVSVMCAVTIVGEEITEARLCAGGVSDRAQRLTAAEQMLCGAAASPSSFAKAADAAADEVSPSADLHGSADFRRDLVRALTRRTLEGAHS